jgi:micrococcal nuclease
VRRAAGVPVVAVLVVVVAACGHRTSGAGPPPSTVLAANASVAAVIDGDTIVAHVGGRTERVRLIGIDTPETVDPQRPVMCFGKEASDRTKRLLPAGTPIELVRDTEPRDAYDRLLAYVYRATDGLFVNLSLAQDGFAATLAIAPNLAHAADFQQAVATAQRGRVGLWGACQRFGQPVASPP